VTQRFDILIVGGGHGGAQAAIALRQGGHEGTIALVSTEPDLPYERPPLSKDYLAGEREFERILIRPAAFWAERKVELLLARDVIGLDAEAHRATLSDGAEIGYGSLIWAAGGAPRRLPGCLVIRSRADADWIRAALPQVTRATVVGGGYIGLEAAAVLRTLGKEVRLIEAANRLLPRVAGERLADFFEGEHRARGVDVRTGTKVESVDPDELVIAGIGIDPVVAPLRAAGAAGDNGVDVDDYCRTSLADIYAVGDCAAHLNRFGGGARVRIESVQNASDQANVAAKAILGRPEPYAAIPWFWSNQYDLKLQTVGLLGGHDEAIVRGDPGTRSFSIVYLKRGQVIALDCVNQVRDYVQGRKLIESAATPAPSRLADPEVALKDLAI
jgi:3-phenylpropionate/trans-cinnamate dioxygenase ferredoxin reductase subunit